MRLWLVVFLLNIAAAVRGDDLPPVPKRDDFPRDFVFGSSTSAYQVNNHPTAPPPTIKCVWFFIALQVERAAAEDGRTQSVWDIFAHIGLFFFPLLNQSCITFVRRNPEISDVQQEQAMETWPQTDITDTRYPSIVFKTSTLSPPVHKRKRNICIRQP